MLLFSRFHPRRPWTYLRKSCCCHPDLCVSLNFPSCVVMTLISHLRCEMASVHQAQTGRVAPQSGWCGSALPALLHHRGDPPSQRCRSLTHTLTHSHTQSFEWACVCLTCVSVQDRGDNGSSRNLCYVILAFIDSCIVWWISFDAHTHIFITHLHSRLT